MKRAPAVLLALLAVACADRTPTSFPLGVEDPTPLPNADRAEGFFSYTTIEVPGALATSAQGINAGGDVVGAYLDAGGVWHAFRFRAAEFATIDYPGAEYTDARGIGPGGDIVGTYAMPGEPGVNLHGYRQSRQGEFTPVDYPGHTNTIAQRILPDGTILGCYHDNDFSTTMRGVVMGRAGNDEIAAFASMHNGATPDLRRIAGLWTDTGTGRTEGYVIDDGVFESFVVPGSIMTAAWDVNPAGEVAGIYRDAGGTFHGFVRSGDTYRSVDFPDATATRTFGINARGDVVGSYVAGGRTYGYLARRNR